MVDVNKTKMSIPAIKLLNDKINMGRITIVGGRRCGKTVSHRFLVNQLMARREAKADNDVGGQVKAFSKINGLNGSKGCGYGY